MDSYIENFLNFLAVEKGFSRNTVAAYRNDLQRLGDFLRENGHAFKEGLTWSQVHRNHIMDYILSLKDRQYSPATVARKVAAAKSFFNFLTAEGITRSNPTENLDTPKVGKSLPKTLTIDEVDKLLEQPQMKDTPSARRDRAMLELLYATGMRVSELVGLNVEHVNLQTGNVRCFGKGMKERILPIHNQAIQALHEYLSEGRPQLVQKPEERALFVNQRGQRLTRQGLWLIIKAYAQKANIKAAVTPHVLRHSFATHMLHRGTPLRNVQEFLGHANISTTQIYTHLTDDYMHREYEKAHPRAK